MKRRIFIYRGSSIFFGSPAISAAASSLNTSPAARFTGSQKQSLLAALQKADQDYDPSVQMIRSKPATVGYHTTVNTGVVHPTRDSLAYAAALLDSGEPARLARAKEILERVIVLQDQDPKHNTYGIWSWYLEEPLEKMSPPDWNWADFCGVQLLACWINHRDRLDADLSAKVQIAMLHAARSIQRRDVTLGYTNIAIMGTYVTLTAAEQLNISDLGEYARQRLHRLHRHYMEQGSFNEYNSPTYSIVALAELCRMLLHVRGEEEKRLIRDLHDLLWKHIAVHFHAPTRQWAGPHSRCYETDLRRRKDILAFLEVGLGRHGHLLAEDPLPLGLDHYRLPIHCPPALRPFFTRLSKPRAVLETFFKDAKGLATEGNTYLHPRFSLGTVNMGDFWRQKRPILAYWGTTLQPCYLQVRFLHDGYDYCSAIPFTVQREGKALTVVVFATDYGDTHPSLDKVKNAAIRAKDLRLRIELGGVVQGISMEKRDAPFEHFQIMQNRLLIRIIPGPGSFNSREIIWKAQHQEHLNCLDAVIYEGDERVIHWDTISPAYLSFALDILPGRGSALLPFPSISLDGQRFQSSWATGGRTATSDIRLSIDTLLKPGPLSLLRASFRSEAGFSILK